MGPKSMIHICEMTPNISQPLLHCESPFLYRKWTACEISGSKICELYKTKDPEFEGFFDISLPNFDLVKITLYDFGIFYLQDIIKYMGQWISYCFDPGAAPIEEYGFYSVFIKKCVFFPNSLQSIPCM